MEIHSKNKKFKWDPTIWDQLGFLLRDFLEVNNMKYTTEVQEKCVEAAKSGMSLKAIQSQFGPNPKATQRYLVKAGIDYQKLRKELIAEGKLKVGAKKNPAAEKPDKKKGQ